MGREKQSQRTRNNAKPSNSSRSAQLLETTPSRTTLTTFPSLAAVQDGVTPGSPLMELLSGTRTQSTPDMGLIDPQLQIVFKKMRKKDSTTKAKALQEFADLCDQVSVEALKAALPLWPRIYSVLVLDLDHRVRVLAHTALGAFLGKVGRAAALFLKQLAGPWFTSRFDTYPPAASTASNTFEETFPGKKSIDALRHCRAEILRYIQENLVERTEDSIFEQESLSQEEKRTGYQRVLVANLKGYRSYLEQLASEEDVDETLESHRKILWSSRFWKLPKHEDPLIRAAFFQVLTAVLQHRQQEKLLLPEQRKKMVVAVFQSLDDTDPGLLVAVWETLLVVIDKVEDWTSLVSIEKLVLPKLWNVLKSAGQSCANVVFPNLLPFLGQVTRFGIDPEKVYTNFFRNMRQGFSARNLQISRSESNAVVSAFTECLRYVVSQSLAQSDSDFARRLIEEQLIPALESATSQMTWLKPHLYKETSELLLYWSACHEKHGLLVQEFWEDLKPMFQRLQGEHSQSLLEFLLFLKNPSRRDSSSYRVRFISSPQGKDSCFHQEPQGPEKEETVPFASDLQSFVEEFLDDYFSETGDIVFLARAVENFDSHSLFRKLAHGNNLEEFQERVLRRFLVEDVPDEVLDATILLVFKYVRHLEMVDANRVLEDLVETENRRVLRRVVERLFSRDNRSDELLRQWRTRQRVVKFLIEVTQEAIDNDFQRSEDIQRILLEAYDDPDIPMEDEISSTLLEAPEKLSFPEGVTRLATFLSEIIDASHRRNQDRPEMLETLFKINVLYHFDPDISSERIRGSWKRGFTRVAKTLREETLTRCGEFVWEMISPRGVQDIPDSLIQVTTDFLHSVIVSEELLKVFLRLEGPVSTWIRRTTDLVTFAEVSCGNLYVSDLEKVKDVDVGSDRARDCLKWARYVAKILIHWHARVENQVQEEEVEEEGKECHDDTRERVETLAFPGIREIYGKIVYVAAVAAVYRRHFKSGSEYGEVTRWFLALKRDLLDLHRFLPEEFLDDVFLEFRSSLRGNPILARVLEFYCNELHPRTQDRLKSFFEEKEPDVEFLLQLIQVFPRLVKLHQVPVDPEDWLQKLNLHRSVLNSGNSETEALELLDSLMKDVEAKTLVLAENLKLVLELNRFLGDLVTVCPRDLTPKEWEFTMIRMTYDLLLLNELLLQEKTCLAQVALVISISECFVPIQKFLQVSSEENSVVDEWRNVFLEDVSRGILETWLSCCSGLAAEDEVHPVRILTLEKVSKCLPFLDITSFPEEDKFLDSTLSWISSRNPNLQHAAFQGLRLLLPRFLERDKELVAGESFDSRNLCVSRFEESLERSQGVLDQILADYKLCDNKRPEGALLPFTEAYSRALEFLQLWALLLELCSLAHGDLRYNYADVLKERFPGLLNVIFRLIPGQAFRTASREKSGKILKMFTEAPCTDFSGAWTETRLEHLVCWTYTECLRHLPVLARQWWSTTDGKVSAAVDRLTTLYVSPMLCREELRLSKVKESPELENLRVKVHPTAREVLAFYEMDDTKLELTMTLPPNHPLGLASVEKGHHAGSASILRNCHMQLSIFLTHQNGSIWDGLLLWKRNLDKRFAGVEECCICFSIFHASTYQIPKLSCRTCKKKFHTSCLYKWFNTSRKSTCPICRNIF